MKRILSDRTFRIFVALAVLVLLSAIFSPRSLKTGTNLFLTWENLASILAQVSMNGILAVGMTFVILIGAIDLSVGTVMALGSITAAMLLMDPEVGAAHHWTIWPSMGALSMAAWTLLGRRTLVALGLIAAMAVGLGLLLLGRAEEGFGLFGVLCLVAGLGTMMGCISGVITACWRIQSFVVTLGMMSIAFGLARMISDNERRDIDYGPGAAAPSFELLNTRLLDVLPFSALLFLGFAFAGAWLLRYTVFGRHVLAVGGNEEAARLSGVRVVRIKVLVFSICGALAGIAGAVFAAQNQQGNPGGGVGKELDAIAAVVIGGTRLTGGVGSILGTVVGVLIIGVLNTTLNLHNVDPNVQKILKGAIIILAAGSFPSR
ncbi:MAG: ABC transporter permease [Planctomycetota bacterium]